MPQATETRRLLCSCYGHEPVEHEASVLTFDPGARLRRALSGAALLTGGALLSLPIPGWHFVGVPGCLAGAVWIFRKRRAESLRVERASGPCPACGAATSLGPVSGLPITRPCEGCGEFLKLTELR